MRNWSVPRDWPGEPVAILASGPSLTREQADLVRGRCRVIAVNNQGITFRNEQGEEVPAVAPWADVLYASDFKWWDHYRQSLKFEGLKVTIRTSPFKEVNYVLQSPQLVYDERPEYLVSGGNSGYQAIHLATHFGSDKIILLGYDMKYQGKKKHWFGDHPKRLNTNGNFVGWLQAFARLAPVLHKKRIQVVNCSPSSALDVFPKKDLEEALREMT